MKKGQVAAVSILGGTLIGTVAGAMGMGKLIGSRFANKPDMTDKYRELFFMMNQWVRIKQSHKSLVVYFEKAGYKKIAVYGMSHAGMTLLNELKNTGIEVVYGIDKRADDVYADIDIVSIDKDLDRVDVIVVTAIFSYEEIKEALSVKVDCPVISLNEIIDFCSK